MIQETWFAASGLVLFVVYRFALDFSFFQNVLY